MDGFTALHLDRWLDSHVRPEDRQATLDTILAFLHDYPDMPETHGWTDILMLAERYAQRVAV